MKYFTSYWYNFRFLWYDQDTLYTSGFNINGCPIARGKLKRHPTCPIEQVKMILWYVQFLKSKKINIELFSVGSRGEFYLNIASYVSCILHHFVLFCWLRNFPFSNKDRVIYSNTASTSYLFILMLHQQQIYFCQQMKS